MARDRLPAELLSQYVADYGAVRDDDPNGWPLSELKSKIQSVIDNPDLKRGNPPPIRPRMSTGLVVKRRPESDFERRNKIARNFPEMIGSRDVYDRLGLDIRKPSDKKVASRVMRAAGFVASRGRRGALWKKVRNGGDKSAGREGRDNPSLPLPHHTDSVTVTPKSTM